MIFQLTKGSLFIYARNGKRTLYGGVYLTGFFESQRNKVIRKKGNLHDLFC